MYAVRSQGEAHLHNDERLDDSESYVQPRKEAQLPEVVVTADELIVSATRQEGYHLHHIWLE